MGDGGQKALKHKGCFAGTRDSGHNRQASFGNTQGKGMDSVQAVCGEHNVTLGKKFFFGKPWSLSVRHTLFQEGRDV